MRESLQRRLLERIPEFVDRAERAIDDADVAGISSHVKAVLRDAEETLKPLPSITERLGKEGSIADAAKEVELGLAPGNADQAD